MIFGIVGFFGLPKLLVLQPLVEDILFSRLLILLDRIDRFPLLLRMRVAFPASGWPLVG